MWWKNMFTYKLCDQFMERRILELDLPLPAEDTEYLMSNEEQLMVYRHQYLTCKEDVLKCIEKQRQKLQAKDSEYAECSEGYCEALIRLYDRLYTSVEYSNLFDAPQQYWHFSIIVDSRGISLKLFHEFGYVDGRVLEYIIDEEGDEYTLFHIPSKLLTIEEYASLHEVKAATVRQWIRRGKIKTALKVGNEWRIPELSDIPNKKREYKDAIYSWENIYEKVPEGFEYIHQYNHVKITRAEDQNQFVLKFYYLNRLEDKKVEEKRVLCDVKEKEKIELFLISCSGVTYQNERKLLFERNDR